MAYNAVTFGDQPIICSTCGVKISGANMETVTLAYRGHRKEVHNFLTGQEFYDRYRAEWNKIVASGNVTPESHIEAARKAAGLDGD